MLEYRAFWASTWYKCENLHALCRALREVGASSFLVAIGEVSPSVKDNLPKSVALILEGEWVK